MNDFVRRDVEGLMEKLLVAALLLVGCGGSPFESTLFNSSAEDDAGSVASSGGAAGFEEDGGVGSGGMTGTGGTGGIETGGASTDGRAPGTGGLREADSAAGMGGGDACALVTHDNGLGQTWQDCVPLGTYTFNQAMKACKASVSTQCLALDWCGPGYTLRGYDASGMFVAEWGVIGHAGGYVAVGDGQGNYNGSACNGGPGSSTWR